MCYFIFSSSHREVDIEASLYTNKRIYPNFLSRMVSVYGVKYVDAIGITAATAIVATGSRALALLESSKFNCHRMM